MRTRAGSVSSDLVVRERLRDAETAAAMAESEVGVGSTVMAFLMSEPLRPTTETPIMTVRRESHLEKTE